MDRRDFLKVAVAAGVGLGVCGLPFGRARAGQAPSAGAAEIPDIVAVRNGEPDVMFDRGIAAMGGMGRFVKPGQTVTIKPNVSWNAAENYGANTNPALVNRIIRQCLDAGASRVVIVDHTIEHGESCFRASGIGAAADDAGAVVAPAGAEGYYHKTAVNGVALKDAMVHEAILEADVLINVPILKHHGGAGITAGIKNFMGAVWDRREYHANDLHQCLADFLHVRSPDLTVMDAYRVLTGNGPRSRSLADVKLMKMQILSTDIVAADASAARLMGREPSAYRHIALAGKMGFGQIDPGQLSGRRISL